MKLLIISAGPGIQEIKEEFGHAIDWISRIIDKSSKIDIYSVDIYSDKNFDESNFDAWIITGSAASVRDNFDWIELLKKKIIYAHKKSIPILGICFGHQIISKIMGGKVKQSKFREFGLAKVKKKITAY